MGAVGRGGRMTTAANTTNAAALWSRLQSFAKKHGEKLHRENSPNRLRMARSTGGRSDSFILTDWDLRETVEILGRGDSEEIAGRIHWYLTYLPELTKRGD